MEKPTLGHGLNLSKPAKDAGLSCAQIQQISDSGVLMDIFEAVKLGKPINREKIRKALKLESLLLTCRVVVDYNFSLSEMIQAGKYNWVNNDIAQNFPFPIQREGKQEMEITLLCFNRYINSDEAMKEMDKAGYRPANIAELLALGAQYPDIQRQFPIVALGSVWRLRSSGPCVPCLWGDDWERGLHLRQLMDKWHLGYRFAVVRKSQNIASA